MPNLSAKVSAKRQHRQRGSALLVVLVFAAIIAIMLYREMPIAAFEAQRQKEQLLVSRGEEYKRGIKLFVRKIGRFPSSIDELENTNRMRFLRHRFVDPLTGKDDWRLIHAGPGGIIIDSKVASTANNKNASTLGQGSTFAGFANSFNGDAAAVAAAAIENTPSAGLRQRPPATKNAGTDTSDPWTAIAGSTSVEDPNNPSLPSGAPPMLGQPPIDPATGQPGQNPLAANGNGVSTLADQLNNINPKMPQTPPQQNNGLSNTSTFGSTPTNVVGNQGAVTSGNQLTAGGGIAGVASKAEGKGVKLINEQSKYKLWEFYYDLRKDQTQGAGLGGTTNTNPNGAAGNNNNGTFGQTQSTFGGTSSTFGSSSTFGNSSNSNNSSGFGSSSTQQTQPPPTQPQSPPQ